jgi:hypothetical protein
VAAAPINLFSHKIDPAGVLALLRQIAPDLKVEGPPDNWTKITITLKGGLFKRGAAIEFGHHRDYYAGPGWPRQVGGMQGYFSQFPDNDVKPRIMLLIQSFRFALTCSSAHGPDLSPDTPDERLKFLFAVARHLDAVLFTPGFLWDASGRILYGAEEPDPAAVMPAIYKEVRSVPRAEHTRAEGGTLPDEDDPLPPTAERVARRTLVLAAVCGRALLEQEDKNDPNVEQTRQRLLAWIKELGLADECEPDEIKLLQHPLGTPPKQDVVNASWYLEGLVVLAWALNRFALSPYDQMVDPGKLLPAVGILNLELAQALLAEPALRPAAELEAYAREILGLHWRLRDFTLRPQAMDFRHFAENAWFGKMPLDNVRLIDGDLALQEFAIAQAPRELFSACMSAAQERHRAINWLQGWNEVYSDVDTST